HPAKAEVRFRSPARVSSGVQRAVRRALLAYSPIPPIANASWQNPYRSGADSSRSLDPSWEMPREVEGLHPGNWGSPEDWEMGRPTGPAAAPGGVDPQSGGVDTHLSTPGSFGAPASTMYPPGQTELPSGALPLLRLIGQVGLAYLVAEGPDGLYLIDQHAAHERVLFERFMRQRSGPIAAQTLLEPATVHLPPASAQVFQSRLEILGELGFQVEPFGPNTYRVRAIPALLTGLDPQAAVRVVVEDFEEDETPLQAEIEAKLIARVCKRAAVKAGQSLSVEEQRVLLRELETCRSPRTCPHGRPTMIHLSVDLLERQFGRRGGR
ncbi:MAG: DNA mismatch repair protein MutL, partial [Chloroflexi bacterium]